MITGGGTSGSGVAAIAFGTAAARPAAAAGNAGTAYFATDTQELTVSNGSTWSNQKTFTQGIIVPPATNSTIGYNNVQGTGGGLSMQGPLTLYNGLLDISNVGSGIKVAEGANAKQGTAVLVAGAVVVANTSVTATSRIFLTSQVDGGAPGFLRVSTRTAGTSFTITSSSGTDTSTVAYEIFEVG